jgi:3-methyladenine DNA glycosylase/8-oxoguanine DNA glycosylase
VTRWEALWPPSDRYAEFAPEDRTVLRLHRSLPGLRLLRHPWLFDIACRSILQQRVTWREALSAWRKLVGRLGDVCGDLRAFPAPARLGRTDPRSLRVFDIDLRRAQAIVALARAELAEPFLGTSTPHRVLRERLRAIPGIGIWTTEKILGGGAGDPDAVPTGDLHLPNTVSWALAGEARGSDERMVELLEPYRGHRYRVLRLLSAGKLKAPAFGPKKPRRPSR